MKKKLLTLLIAVSAAVSLFAFTACNTSPVSEIVIDDQPSFIFTASNGVMTITGDTYVIDYLNALKGSGDIDMKGNDGEFGFYISEINGHKEEISADGHSGKSWMLYTDLTTLDGVIYSTPDYTVEYEGKKYNSANYGVSALPCVDGYTYILVLADWSY